MNQSWQQSTLQSPNQNPQDYPGFPPPSAGTCPSCGGALLTWVQDDKWRAVCGLCNYQTQP